MDNSNKMLYVCTLVILMSMVFTAGAQAEKIIWVSRGDADTLGNVWDQEWVDMLVDAGYEVQREDSTMVIQDGESFLITEQLDILESGDLVIFSRANNSGNFVDPSGWNGMIKPMLLLSAYLSRDNRWQWFNNSNLLGDGSYKAVYYSVENPEHPIFTGVEPDDNGAVAVLDTSVGTGNTSLPDVMDWGDGQLLATVTETATPSIVYWPQEYPFHPDTDQFAGAPRLLFCAGTREPAGGDLPNALHGWGQCNLTPEGKKMFLNAVAWMLGKEVRVETNSSALPQDIHLAQNYPNPFNPSTTIEFSLAQASLVKLSIFNMLGQEITTLANRTLQPGTYQFTWNGVDGSGQQVESGVYVYQLESKSEKRVKKMLLIK